MSGESPTFQEGQEVSVCFTARVAEVRRGMSVSGGDLVRLEALHSAPLTGWIDVAQALGEDHLTIEVTHVPLPTVPGMYRRWVGDALPEDADAWTCDGYEFYYLNQAGNWVDIGFGNVPPDTNTKGLERMDTDPF